MIKVSITIDRAPAIVWDYFTKTENWIKWYGGELKEVVPGWQQGGKLIWGLGGASTISAIIPYVEICISGGWMDDTFKFNNIGNIATAVEIIESDPKGTATLKDGGAASKAEWEKTIRKFKSYIESETKNELPDIKPSVESTTKNTIAPEIKTVTGNGETIALAFANAELQIPKNSLILDKITLSEPIEKTIDIELSENQTVEEKFNLLFGKTYLLKKSSIKNEGKKGFLGFGKKLTVYTITFTYPAIVQIKFQV